MRTDADADRLEQRDREYYERVRTGFLAEAAKRPDVIRVIDASKSIEEVHQSICAAALDCLACES